MKVLSIWLNDQSSCVTPRLNTLHGCVRGQRAGIVGSWRERQGNAVALKASSAKHPCVHEIRVSTSDSCCWVVTVKQIMAAGGSSKDSTELQHVVVTWMVQQSQAHFYKL